MSPAATSALVKATAARRQTPPVPPRAAFAARLARAPLALAGITIVAAYLAAALAAPAIAPDDPLRMHSDALLAPPGARHPFGTDQFGRDLATRLLYGAQSSLAVAFGSVALALAAGGTAGITGGYHGGALDNVLMRTMDVIFAFPAVLLAIAIMAVAGTALGNVIVAIGIVYTPQFARVVRASVLETRGLEYVEAAGALGAGTARILARHILPNIGAPLIVQTSLSLSFAILTESALSFLGLGTQPPTPSWGNMLAEARRFMVIAPWTAVFPGAAIALIVLGFNLLGDGLRDLLDPRLKL
ncbi:MAG TPA: ABC transporter permease [bacterium]|nr:ABC transporter permease [bacterium]